METMKEFIPTILGFILSIIILINIKTVVNQIKQHISKIILSMGVSSALIMGVTTPKFTSFAFEFLGLKGKWLFPNKGG